MKKLLTVEEFVEEYAKLTIIEGSTLTGGSSRLYHNNIVKKLYKLKQKYFIDKEFAFQVLDTLLNNANDRVRQIAAVDSLRYDVFELTDKAISILEEVSKRPDIWGGGAEMALRIYRGEIEDKTL
jgi:hypothetical protein